MKHWVFAAAAIMAAGSPGEGRADATAASAAQCDAAWFYAQTIMSALGDRPLVFDSGSFFFGQLPGDQASWYLPQNGQSVPVLGPPAELVGSLTGENALSLCPSLGERLTVRHVRYGESAVHWARRRRSHGSYRAGIVTITVPVLSADGQHAVFGVSTVFGPLGGGAEIVHLVRTGAGGWQIAGSFGLWVS